MEDIIAYSIIVIFPLVVIFGAVLLQRRYIRNKVRKIKLLQESEERKRRYLEQQHRDKQKEKEAIAELYNKGLVGREQRELQTLIDELERHIVHQDKSLQAAALELRALEPIAWITDNYEQDRSATTFNAEVAKRWKEKGWRVAPLYALDEVKHD